MRVSQAADVLEQGVVEDSGDLPIPQIQLPGQRRGDQARAHRVVRGKAEPVIRDQRETGQQVGEPNIAHDGRDLSPANPAGYGVRQVKPLSRINPQLLIQASALGVHPAGDRGGWAKRRRPSRRRLVTQCPSADGLRVGSSPIGTEA